MDVASSIDAPVLTAEDWAFIDGPLEAVPGWLNKSTSAATIALLREQDRLLGSQPMVEIGVYGGKYFALLARHAQGVGAKVLGLDIFYAFSPDQVRQHVDRALAPASPPEYDFRVGRSQELTAQEFEALGGSKYRFIHIDGSHEAPHVLTDFQLCEPALAEGGIIAIDDFFSPYDGGVTEAFFRFQILHGAPLVPFAYVANKAFACRKEHAPAYRAALERFFMGDSVLPASQRFRDRITSAGGRRMVAPKLFEEEMLVAV